jgi:hypothetical protein
MRKVWRKAKPGMKIRCTHGLGGLPGIKGPYDGEVYTIRELRRGLYNTWALGFTLNEIVNEVDSEQGSEPFFSADCFEILDGDG